VLAERHWYRRASKREREKNDCQLTCNKQHDRFRPTILEGKLHPSLFVLEVSSGPNEDWRFLAVVLAQANFGLFVSPRHEIVHALVRRFQDDGRKIFESQIVDVRLESVLNIRRQQNRDRISSGGHRKDQSYQHTTPTHRLDRLREPPIAGICQEPRIFPKNKLGDNVQSKPISNLSQVDRFAPLVDNITTVPSGIQTLNKNINIGHHSLLQRIQVLRTKKLRMNLAFEPHQPVLGASDKVQCAAADAESRVSFVLADVGADAVDVGVGAGVVEGE
jgi:hypothetical protein